MSSSCDTFYRHHRGGQGAVVIVRAFKGEQEQIGVFSSIEIAQSWRNSLGDDYACVFCPYIVDDPDWGNEALSR